MSPVRTCGIYASNIYNRSDLNDSPDLRERLCGFASHQDSRQQQCWQLFYHHYEHMSDLIKPNITYDWDQLTTVTLTESEWLDVKCFLVNAREHETDKLLIEHNRNLRCKIDSQLKHGVAQ